MKLASMAPASNVPLDYDRRHLALYALLLDAHAAGIDWVQGAQSILGLEAGIDCASARQCWESHLARARWIAGEGLDDAVRTFGT